MAVCLTGSLLCSTSSKRGSPVLPRCGLSGIDTSISLQHDSAITKNKECVLELIGSILGKFIGALLPAAIKKLAYSSPNLNGTWVYEQFTTQTAFKPYFRMTLRYLALLTIDGNKISGTAEKIWESSARGGEREYVGKNRSTATIHGFVKNKIFGQPELVIHLIENGHGRKYSTQHLVKVVNANLLEGRFSSTAADQIGSCKWDRRTT